MALSVFACSAELPPPEAAVQREPPVVFVPEAPPTPAVAREVSVVPAPTSAADVSGTWVGQAIEQVGDQELSYQVCLQIPKELTEIGSVAYSDGITCSGLIRYIGYENMRHMFTEYLNSGNVANGGECADTGRIEISLNPDGSLAWSWFQDLEKSPQVMATLSEADSCP